MRIIRGIAALLLTTLAVGALAGCSSEGGDGGSLFGGSKDAVVSVNGTEMTRSELDTLYEQVLAQAGGEIDEATAAEYKKMLVEEWIQKTLIIENAEDLGADLSDDTIDQRLASLMGTDDKATIEEMLSTNGMDMDFANESIKYELASEFIQVAASTEATLTTVPAAYSLLSHILVDDEALAMELAEKVRNGEDFAELAVANSTDSGSAATGGSLGWAQTIMYVPEFAAAADALKVGEVSDPVQSDYGWHIILKQDEVAEGSEIADVPAELSDILAADSGELAFQAYVTGLRDAAEIEYLDETFKPAE
ncbi:MAG: peptidylprolyl isomerase [Coriobacteriia bacterium]|nr:peptidylprolyl isomerase [Coriobacteriia bacterium]